MKKMLFTCLSCIVTLVWGGENIAIVKSIHGNVLLKRNNGYLPINKGENLEAGDLLQTADNSNIGLIFNDGTALSLGSKSMLTLNKYLFKPSSHEYDFDVTLKKGSAAFESGKIGKLAPEKVAFKVPQGSIGIRGTKFIVDAKE